MANRRMFSLDVVDTDNFLDMPLSAQGLYFHFGMRADDDGFLSSPRKITKIVNASEDDLRLLIAKGYLIPFESGVIVIRHWRQNNYVKGDRYKQTVYQEEKNQLLSENNVYHLDTERIQNGIQRNTNEVQAKSTVEAQDRLGKDRLELGKDSLNTSCTVLENSGTILEENSAIRLPLNDGTEYPIYEKDIGQWEELYAAVDVVQELKNMKGWLDANATKRKTRRGIRRFINGWLAKKQDRGGVRSGGNFDGAGKNTTADTTTGNYQYGDVF